MKLFAITLLALLSACSRSEPVATGRQIGVILSRTGPAAPYGLDNEKGLLLAESVLTALDSGRGFAPALDIQDDAGNPDQAVTLARRFAADTNVCAILGPTRTGSSVAVAALLPSLRVPMVSVGSTGAWPGQFNEWTFRTTRVDTYLIEPLLRAARDRLGIRRLAIIYTIDDDWSRSVLAVYESTATQLGMSIVSTQSQRTGDTDRSPQLTRIRAANPDGLIINTLATDAPSIAAQARRLGIRARFIGTAGFTNPQTWSLAGPGVLDSSLLAENYYRDSDRNAVQRFVQAFETRFNEDPPPYAAYAYDGLMLVADAIRRAGSCDRGAIRNALAVTTNFDAVLGNLTFHGSGDARKDPILLMIVDDRYVRFQ